MSGWGNLLDKFKPKPGEWKCAVCLVMNPASANKCVSCETAKPGSAGGGGSGSSSGGAAMGSIGAGGFSFGGAPAPAPQAGIGAGGFSFNAAKAPAAAEKKRQRTDGQVSKEEYAAVQSVNSAPGNFSRASGSVLAGRKIVRGKRDKNEEFSRHLTALNTNFAKYIDNLMRNNPCSPWDNAIQDYLAYINELERRYVSTTRKGQVFTFGSGECGQLAHGVDRDQDLMVKAPRIVRALRDKQICKIACGGQHNAAITTNGQVYTWGCNDDGSLGRKGDENMPALVEGIDSQDVVIAVVAGDTHTAALSLSGEVYSWGCYRDVDGKQWFHADTAKGCYKFKQETAMVIPGLPEVIEIASGAAFTAARCSDGSMYTWGIDLCGEMGRGPLCTIKNKHTGEVDVNGVFSQHLTPASPRLADGSAVTGVKAMGCGQNHIMVFAFGGRSSGELYTSGLNNYGQLGLGGAPSTGSVSPENKEQLTLVRSMTGKQVIQLEGGNHHTMALTVDGQVYAWGRGDSGQLGTDDVCKSGYYEDEPVRVPIPSNPHVSSISCGGNHCLVLTDASDVYTWGYGEMFSLGHGKDKDENRPTKLDWKKNEFATARIMQVGGGGQHSALIIEDS